MIQTIINQQEMGNRIMLLRKQKQLSQAETAQLLLMPRSSFVQVEAGKRVLSAIELVKLSKVFQFSIDQLVSDDFNLKSLTETTTTEEPYLRISEPNLDVQKMENVLLYVLERCAGKANITENTLHILLYFCDFNHYEQYEHQFTGAEYRKINNAPMPMDITALLQRMERQKQITTLKVKQNETTKRRFIPLQKANLEQLKASETAIIEQVLHQIGDWSETALLQYAQNDMPMRATKDNQQIEYELAFYREPPYNFE